MIGRVERRSSKIFGLYFFQVVLCAFQTMFVTFMYRVREMDRQGPVTELKLPEVAGIVLIPQVNQG